MRLAMVTSYPDSVNQPAGGVQAVVACLVPALLRQRPDLDLHVIRWTETDGRASYTQGEPPYTVHNVQARPTLMGCRPHKAIEQKLRELTPDVIHVQGNAPYVDARHYPAVLTIHGIPEEDTLYRPHRFPRLRSYILRRVNRPARKRYPHTIMIASYVMQRLSEDLAGQCHFIPNPIESQFFEGLRQESGPRVLFVGSVIPRKNVHGLIEAVGRLTRQGVDCQLRIAGPRPNKAYTRKIDERIRHLGLEGRVEFLGSLTRSVLQSELAKTRCLALPSFQETAPMVIAEANAAGVPAVVAPSGGAAEMVSHGYCGILVDPTSPESIAAGIRPLLEDASLAEEFGRRAKDRAEVYRSDRVAQQTLAVYSEAIQDWQKKGSH